MDASNVTDSPGYYFALYGLLSFLLVMMGVMLLYVACSKKYRLNWFEKNLLEVAEASELRQSQEALISVAGGDSQAGSSRTLNRSPSRDKFWVPPSLHRQASTCQSDSSGDSIPDSPTTPPGYPGSPFPQQTQESENSQVALPLARSDKHVVLSTTNPSRPRVSSMHTKLDHTKIDMTLYDKPSSPQSPSEAEDIRGTIQITLTYDPAAGILTVKLVEARNLQTRDLSGTADPYAKIRLLPDRSNVWQTRIHKRTLCPVFDEDFVFEVRSTLISRRTLEILVYDFDAYARHHNIGGVKLSLGHINLAEKVTMWKGLVPCSEQDGKEELGDLMVSLSFLPSAERMTVVLVKARNLRVIDDTRSSSDPYVKVSLLIGGKRVKKRKTRVYRNTLCPVFNEALTFDVTRDAVSKCSIELCVFHDSLLGPSEPLGKTLVGPTCERELFNEMLTNNTTLAQWLPLKESL